MSVPKASISANKNISPEGNASTEPMNMFLQGVGVGKFASYELNSTSTEMVQWVSPETDSDGRPLKVRIPEEVTTVYTRDEELTVAGKTYPDFKHFLKTQDGQWGEDMYGRRVLCAAERFPCFDSYDYMYENRCYRWYFIRNGNSISRVAATDEINKIYVTDDVANVDSLVWKKMKETGFCQRPEG